MIVLVFEKKGTSASVGELYLYVVGCFEVEVETEVQRQIFEQMQWRSQGGGAPGP